MHDHAQLHEALASGSVPRRRVLETLGLTMAAAFAADPLSKLTAVLGAQVRAAGKIFPLTHVNHFVLSVPNYPRTRDFYVDLFGMRVAWDDTKQCQLDFGDPKKPNSLYVRTVPNPGDKAFVNHIAFSLDDFMGSKAAMQAEFERRGMKVRPDGEVGWTYQSPGGPGGFQVTPIKHDAMYPGAAAFCEDAMAEKCWQTYRSGLISLNKLPKPSGRGFVATAFSHMMLRSTDVDADKGLYRDMFGMKVISEKGGANPEAILRFGDNTLYLRKTRSPQDKPSIDTHFGFVIRNWNEGNVKAELERRGLNPRAATKRAWTFTDPDGFQVDVAAAGLTDSLDA